MGYKRYYIGAGASTTAGGIVSASSGFSTINGSALAREGDPVDCPACGTQGVVKCVAPRFSDSFEGREYALSDDLCICACHPPPRLVADQCDEFQVVSADTPTAQA